MYFEYYNEEQTRKLINKININIYKDLNKLYIANDKDIFIKKTLSSCLNLIVNHTNRYTIDVYLFDKIKYLDINHNNKYNNSKYNNFKINVFINNSDHKYYYTGIVILTYNNYCYVFCSNSCNSSDLYKISASNINKDKLLFLAMDNTL